MMMNLKKLGIMLLGGTVLASFSTPVIQVKADDATTQSQQNNSNSLDTSSSNQDESNSSVNDINLKAFYGTLQRKASWKHQMPFTKLMLIQLKQVMVTNQLQGLYG